MGASPDLPSKASIPPRHLGRLATWPRADAQQPKRRPQRISTSGKALPSPAKPFARGLVPAYLVWALLRERERERVRVASGETFSISRAIAAPTRPSPSVGQCWSRAGVDVDAD